MKTTFERFRPSPETSEPTKGRFYGLRVLWDPDYGLALIADEQVTSLSENAVRIEDGESDDLQFTPDEVRWLHGVLGKLVAVMQQHDREMFLEPPPPHPATA